MAKTVYNAGPTIPGFRDAGAMIMIPHGTSTQPDTVATRAAIKLGAQGVIELAENAPAGESLKSVHGRQRAAANDRYAKWDADQKVVKAGGHPDPPPTTAQLTAPFNRRAQVAQAKAAAVDAQITADVAANNAEVVEKAAADVEGPPAE